MSAENINKVIITDVGSTTTKALYFKKENNKWHFVARGEAATTVEDPFADVMIGVLHSIEMLQERSQEVLLIETPEGKEPTGSTYLSTSSAGGGLQMVVCGHVGHISAESAERAALGGGAVLLDVFAADDGRSLFQRMERLRTLRPDMILLSGGVDGAEPGYFIIEMCDFIRSAQPKPKFGYQYTLPIIYAGTSKAISLVEDLLGDQFALKIVDNLRPSFQQENLTPTREAIHELFIEHVMSHAPGYSRLSQLTAHDLMPTPTAVGNILMKYASKTRKNVLCVDIGGATTDVFSVVDGQYIRTVSANYGMSYSIGNVAGSAGIENIERWLPFDSLKEEELLERIGNKLIYPTTIPATEEELLMEQAVAREALRLSFVDHKEIAKIQKPFGLFGVVISSEKKEITIENFDCIIGSGGVLSNAPNRAQSALMLLDAFQPVGAVELMVDSIFMLPHLGIFAELDEDGALDLLEKECLIPLGTALAPSGSGTNGQAALQVKGTKSNGETINVTANWGELLRIPLGENEAAELSVTASNGARWPISQSRITVRGGTSGIIIDARGRNLENDTEFKYQEDWLKAMNN